MRGRLRVLVLLCCADARCRQRRTDRRRPAGQARVAILLTAIVGAGCAAGVDRAVFRNDRAPSGRSVAQGPAEEFQTVIVRAPIAPTTSGSTAIDRAATGSQTTVASAPETRSAAPSRIAAAAATPASPRPSPGAERPESLSRFLQDEAPTSLADAGRSGLSIVPESDRLGGTAGAGIGHAGGFGSGAAIGGDEVAPLVPAGGELAPESLPEPSRVIPPSEPALPGDGRPQQPIDLGAALALVSGQNADVAFARWRVQEAQARLDQARVLWLPSIQFGVNYHRHDGNLQNIEGRIVDINRSSLNAGFGAGAVAAGSTTHPGLVARFHLADAVFQPQIAERAAWARGHAADAVVQERMLDAALAYLELLDAAQAIAIAQDELAHTAQLAELTDAFARTGQGLPADADRARTEAALRRNGLLRAQERFAVASARLAEVLSVDPGCQLLPCELTVAPMELVAPGVAPCELLTAGLTHRPELRESRCLVAEACERLRREQYAPLVPSLLLGVSYGGFGGGVGGNVARFHDRADFDALAVWEVRNLGFGERAARQTAGAQVEQARSQQVRLMDRIAREIHEARAQCDFRRQRIAVSEAAIVSAEESYERNLSRIREGQGLPIEALQSIAALAAARREYLSATIDYNAAQFRLHRALGWPSPSAGP